MSDERQDLAPELDELDIAYGRLQTENARLESQLADVIRAGDLERARMAALIEACEALAELEAARAFIREIRGAILIGGWKTRQRALLRAYDEATARKT